MDNEEKKSNKVSGTASRSKKLIRIYILIHFQHIKSKKPICPLPKHERHARGEIKLRVKDDTDNDAR